MPTAVGPNTKGEENLVFGYDLRDVKNSYRGEPTTNMWGIETGFDVNQRSNWSMPYAYNGAITDTVYTSGTWNGNRIWEVLHTAGTSGYGGYESWRLCVNQPTAGTGTYSTTRRVAIKICVLEGSITDMALHSGGGNGGYNGDNWIPIPESQVPRDCPIKTGWYQFLADGSWASDSVGHCVGLGFISYNRVKILTTEPMYYPSSHLIPFTGYQRSATQGLLDLTGNSTIDLTNVSFDSSAQMTFDGTNDYATFSHASGQEPLSNVTFEAVVKLTSTSNYKGMFMKSNYGNSNGYIAVHTTSNGYMRLECSDTLGSTRALDTAAVGTNTRFTPNETVHFMLTYDGTNIRTYINSVLKDTYAWSYGLGNNQGDLELGRFWAGSWAGDIFLFKQYNRALTVSEVKSNYNAIKGRFNI